jgi:hypothetical protein
MAVDQRIQWADNVRAASWIGSQLHPWNQDTGSVIPEGFDAYCRVFHPEGPIYPDGSFQSWADIADRNGRIAHPNMQFHMINRPVGSPPPDMLHEGSGPSEGSLLPRERRHLVELLRAKTGTPEHCWFCIWDGYGNIEVRGPLVELPNRNYGLYEGPIDVAMVALDVPWMDQSPNLWWPQDRSWIVVTEIDYAWTYVGGSKELINELCSDAIIEAMQVRLDDQPYWKGDTLNFDVES